MANVLDRLKGNKVLIRGNHDPKEITDNGKHVIMSHYPMPFHKTDYNENCFMLYGHVHATREYGFLKKIRTDIKYSAFS